MRVIVRNCVVVLLVLLLSITSVPMYAEDVDGDLESVVADTTLKEQKISGELLRRMKGISDENSQSQKIPVLIWYEDIDEKEVLRTVKLETGLNISSLDTDLEMPPEEIISKLQLLSDKSKRLTENACAEEMELYLWKTKKLK